MVAAGIRPGGENRIILFKSCFPNSNLEGNPDDPPAAELSYDLTVANAKAVYNNLLTYFQTRPDKLFIVITAPPLRASETDAARAANARAFNSWLVDDWLDGYPLANVAVFDYYNVLTAPDNHHRWNNNAVEHVIATASNTAHYPSEDDHPSTAGQQKATSEFVPLLNYWYQRWQSSGGTIPSTSPTSPRPLPWQTEIAIINTGRSNRHRHAEGRQRRTVSLWKPRRMSRFPPAAGDRSMLPMNLQTTRTSDTSSSNRISTRSRDTRSFTVNGTYQNGHSRSQRGEHLEHLYSAHRLGR